MLSPDAQETETQDNPPFELHASPWEVGTVPILPRGHKALVHEKFAQRDARV